MIYVTGDCHRKFWRFCQQNFPQQKEMTRQDYVIVCGDMGIYEKEECRLQILEYFARKPFTVLFVDGNHDRLDVLEQYPLMSWKGGQVRKLSENVLYMPRGEVYEIDGKVFFTFGGAKSYHLRKCINEHELPTLEEMERGRNHLKQVHYQVDFVITHCAPSHMLENLTSMLESIETDVLTEYLAELEETLTYEKWCCGHYHLHWVSEDGSFEVLFENIEPLYQM